MASDRHLNSVAAYTEARFINTVALLILENLNGHWTDLPEYQKGWLEGYMNAWHEMTGHSKYSLIDRANKTVEGSGKKLVMS